MKKSLSDRLGWYIDGPTEYMLCRISPRYRYQYMRMIVQRDRLRHSKLFYNFKKCLKAGLFEPAEHFAAEMQRRAPSLPAGWIAMARLHMAMNNKPQAQACADIVMRKISQIPASIRRSLNATGLRVKREVERMKNNNCPWQRHFQQLDELAGASW